MATVSSLVTVFLDPDSNEPLALSALGEGDVISERIGGTGRTDISGLVSSVGNVNISYNSTTRQFVVDEVSGVSAEVTFESVRDALASGSGELAFSGDFVISGGGKFRGDLSGNLSGTALSATNAISVPGVTINGLQLAANAGAFITGDPTNESSVRTALASATGAVTLNNKNLSSVGEIRASVVSATTLSGNLSGVATRAEAVTGVIINSTSYNLSSGTNINISTTATVDFPSVSSAIFSATGPLFFNNQDTSGIRDLRASSLSSTTTVVAVGNITGGGLRTTGNLNVTGDSTFTGTIRGTTVSATTSLSSPAATITSFTGTDIRATNSVSAESFSATSGRISTLSALTSFSAPTITIGGITATGTANFNGASNNFNGLTVTANQGLFQAGVIVTGTLTATDVRGTTSVSAASVSAANTIDAPIVRTSNYFSGNLSGNAVSATFASAIDNVTINGTSVNLRTGGTVSIAATGTVSFSGVKDALEAATSGVGFNSQEISGISTGRFGDLRASASVSSASAFSPFTSSTDLRFNNTASGTIVIASDSVRSDIFRNQSSTTLLISSTNNNNIEINSNGTGIVRIIPTAGSGVEIGRAGITTTTKGLLRVNEAATFDTSLSANSVSGLTGRFNTNVSSLSILADSVVTDLLRNPNGANLTVSTGGVSLGDILIDARQTQTVKVGSISGTVELGRTGITTTTKGLLRVNEAATFDTSLSANSVSGLTGRFNTSVSTPTLEVDSVLSKNGSMQISSVLGANTNIWGNSVYINNDLTGKTEIINGSLEAPIIRSTNYFSGNLSGLATSADNARLIPGCLINGSAVSANASITIAAGSVDFTSVSGAIFTGTGPLTFNGKDLNGVEDISASGDLRASSVSATNVSGLTGRFNTSLSTPSFTGTTTNAGTLSVTSTSTFNNTVSVTANGLNVTGNSTFTNDITAARVKATTEFSGVSATINGSATITGGLTTTSLQLNGSGRVTGSLTVNGNSTLGTNSGDSISLNSPLTITNAAGAAPITIQGGSKAIAFNGAAVSLNMNGNNAAISLTGTAPNITMGSGASLNVNNDGSGYISYVSAGYLKVGDITVIGTTGGALAQGVLTFGNEANFTSDINVSGDLYVTSLTPTATGNYVLTVSSGGSGLISNKKLVTGAVLPVGGIEPAFFDGSLIRYEQTGGFYQPAQYVRVTASDAGLELTQGVGISIADAGYVAIGGGGTLSVTGVSTLSSLLVPSSVSATTYLNLPSATLVWYEANNAQRVLKYVKNGTAASMPKGTPVTVTGTTGDVANVAILSSVNTHVPEAVGFSNHVFGLTDTTIAAGGFGYIVTEGAVSGNGGDHLDTSLFSGGDILYVSSNGKLNNIRPPAPYEAHPVGYVVRSQANNGIIYVKVETVPEINDIVGFDLASSIINGDLISYDLTTSTFKNVQSINISGTIKGGTVSATNYANLPSTSAIWNANKIQNTTVNSTAPSKSQNLQYVSTGEWKPNWNEVSTITASSVTLTTDIDYWFASAENGPMNLTLPDASTCQGKFMSIIKSDTSGQVVTVSGGSINTILNRVKIRMPREQIELLSNGSSWVVLSHDRDYGGDTMDSDTNAVFDDFIQGSTETGEAGYAGWSFTNGSITALAATTFSGSMGAFRRGSGSTANQVASFYPLNAGTNTSVLTEHCVEFKLRGRASTTGTDHTVQLGLTSDMTTITPVNGFYFERAAASGTWDAVTRRASSERRINTGITYQNINGPDTFRIFIKDLNNVQFYINDVLVANETNVSNTIPLAGIAVLPGFNITPTTTTARNFDIDYIAYTFDGILERY